MTVWTEISDLDLAPGQPAKSAQALALRDNVAAQAEGAVGAPKNQTDSIENDAITADKLAETQDESDWVEGRTAGVTSPNVGTYALLYLQTGSPQTAPGTIVSGTPNLMYAGTAINPSGSWQSMGYGNANVNTLWLRTG